MVKALVILMFPVMAHAQFLTGNDLFERMNSDNIAGKSIALGYVGGVLDVHLDVNICPPQSVQLGQALDVAKKWLSSNPDKRHLPAAMIVYHSLRSVWPCKKDPMTPGTKM